MTAETESYVKGVQTDTEAEYQSVVAEGELAVELAKGIGKRLHLEALAGEGGAIWLAREALLGPPGPA